MFIWWTQRTVHGGHWGEYMVGTKDSTWRTQRMVHGGLKGKYMAGTKDSTWRTQMIIHDSWVRNAVMDELCTRDKDLNESCTQQVHQITSFIILCGGWIVQSMVALVVTMIQHRTDQQNKMVCACLLRISTLFPQPKLPRKSSSNLKLPN